MDVCDKNLAYEKYRNQKSEARNKNVEKRLLVELWNCGMVELFNR